jgi:DNA primase
MSVLLFCLILTGKKKKKQTKANKNLFFRKNLDQNKNAESYLLDRGIYESSIEKFEIGYAPESHNTLDYMRSSSVSYTDAKDLGLVAVGENGKPYARFSKRITFPIFSPNGKIVGFGGRTITDHPAKYINSPQSNIFNKSKTFYGFNIAKHSIYKIKKMIITEGYLDVMMLHQAGFNNVVAVLGTALTEEHIPLIKKTEAEIILAFDSDNAGIEAALKSAKLLMINDIDGGIAIFNKDSDPADMVKNKEIEKLNYIFNHPIDFMEFIMDKTIENFNIKKPIQQRKAFEIIKEFILKLDKISQQEYLNILAFKLNIDPNIINKKNINLINKNNINNINKNFNINEDFIELAIIKTALENPNLIDNIVDTIEINSFTTHQEELRLLFLEDFNNNLLIKIAIRDDIQIYTEDEFNKQLCIFLLLEYKKELNYILIDSSLSIKKKSFLIKECKLKIQTIENVIKESY